MRLLPAKAIKPIVEVSHSALETNRYASPSGLSSVLNSEVGMPGHKSRFSGKTAKRRTNLEFRLSAHPAGNSGTALASPQASS